MSPLAQVRLVLFNDLRLLWRALMSRKLASIGSTILIGIVLLALHAVFIMLFLGSENGLPLGAEAMTWSFFAFLMLGAAMTHAIALLFEGNDFDLLLSSPIAPRIVLTTRILTICSSAWLSSALLLAPMLNGAIIGSSPRYLAGYATWFALTACCAAVGTTCTLGLVKWLGAKRARTWVQVLGAITGALVYLTFQSQRFVGDDERNVVWEYALVVFNSPPAMTLARSARGSWMDLLIVVGTATAALAITARQLAATFLTGIQESGDHVTRKRRKGRFLIREGAFRATFWKEVRLIARDPLLLAQILPTAMYVLPALFGFQRFGGMAMLAPLAVVVGAQFSLLLATVAVGGEECLDLIISSPLPEVRLRTAKMAAAMALPVALTTVLCGIVAWMGRPGLAAAALLTSVATASACTWLKASEVTPAPRADILKRRRGGGGNPFTVRGISSAAMMMLAAIAIGVLAGDGSVLVVALLLGILALCILACFVFVSPKELVVG
jgi:ABC-2 type transport system permease protein